MSDNAVLGALARLEAGQQAQSRQFDGFGADIAALRDAHTSLRVDLMARMDRLENRLTEIRDDIGVNMGRADRAHESAVNTREEVRQLGQELTVLWRQIKRLESEVREIRGEAA